MKSVLVKASAGSGKTTKLTQEVFRRIGGKFIIALTFTRAATTEMRSRIMREIADQRDIPLLEKLRLIMEAGRVGYSTIDSFFYRLFVASGAASGFAPQLADEKTQTKMLREIKTLFRDRVRQNALADKIIIAARILGTDIDRLWEPLAEEQTVERCLLDRERLADIDKLMRENGVLKNKLISLAEKAASLSDQAAPAVKSRVINYLGDYDNFVSKTLATHADLENYTSLGKNIKWDEKPYRQLNKIFQEYRNVAESLALNKALLRELALASLCEIYLEAADAVKREKGLIFFHDVRRKLLALDGDDNRERPALMSHYFSLGLDRTEHLLIDEFQDTSKGDIQILLPLIDEILAGGGERGERSFFAVGDWKQMIYGWRGADREALEEAIGRYLNNGTISEESLAYNYRSTPLLISFFNELIGHLYEGKEKSETQMPPEDSDDFEGVTEVNLVELEKDGLSEASFYPAIVEYLMKKKAEYGCAWGDMAVLALTNNHVQKIEAELLKNRIGVAAVKGRQLLSTPEGVAVMIFIAAALGNDAPFITAAADSILRKEIFGEIKELQAKFARQYPRPYGLMAVSHALELLRGKIPTNILDIWQDEARIFFGAGGDADEFLSRMFTVRFNIKVPEAEKSANIKVDTIHGTKGLQFSHVFVFWNEDEKSAPVYLKSEHCHVQFSQREIEFFKASDSDVAEEIINNYLAGQMKQRRERANVFYVAATRAVQTLTVFLPKKKSETYKPVHQAVLDAFCSFAPGGSKKEIYSSSRGEEKTVTVEILDVPVRHAGEPEKYGEIDPTLLSISIKRGIMRGERLHRWLAKVIDPKELPPPGELNPEEYEAVLRFLERKDVAEIVFRPGKVYTEQQISDKESFGVVDRMIVDDERVTIIDYKSGSMKGLRQKYDEQLRRYTKIMKSLYPGKKVEYYMLSIDF
ncbi:MAG TPA: UvrD-helicase domain-containing protein [Smithellaceae bacterium]|nr:UvrD-helicase domain-containing protein [Smithellaceae bacterium]HRS88621.1 UvrD-helicase domain-containing protein [Smithellaceae bacterium]HRV25901.1 UvrD-helicase domain-containing protein [Smithellaceae bacterium]